MLDKLDEIPWKDLRHAYGSAEDVPGLLRTLAGSDIRQVEALYELFGNIWHQGTVYEASSYAVPFLIEFAADARLARRDEILGLVAAIAKGNSYLEVHAREGLSWGERLRQQPDFEQRLRGELDHVERARAAVRRQDGVIVSLVSDSVPMVRAAAAHVLSCFPESVKEFGPVVVNAAKKEGNRLALAGMLWCIGLMDDGLPSVMGFLDKVLRRTEDPRQAYAAAVAIYRLSGKWSDAADAICARMKAANWFAEGFLCGVPWDFGAEFESEDLLSGIEADPSGATRMLLKVLRDDDTSADIYSSVVHDLLHLNYQKGEWRHQEARWTAAQQEVIRALVATDKAWLDTKRLWFLLPNGATRIPSLTTLDIQAVRNEMAAALAHHEGL